MKWRSKSAIASAAILALQLTPALAQDKPYDGMTLTLASQNDQFAAVMADLAPQFTEETGATVKVDILSYPELLTKVTSDYIGDTKGYDIATMDIVWAGQFAESGYTVDLTDWIKRDAAEIDVDDIYPVLMTALGNYDGKQVAFPFAGYANVLAYRNDLYEAAGLEPPKTMEELVADAMKLTDPSKPIYGFVANGQKGPAVAQDWMQYNAQMGGSILGADGKPALNSDANVESLTDLQGAVRQGRASRRRRLRLGRPRGELPPGPRRQHADLVDRRGRLQRSRRSRRSSARPASSSRLPAKACRRNTASAAGAWPSMPTSTQRTQEAAWAFIKWITSPAVHKEMNMSGAGSYLRISETHDADLLAKVSVPAGHRRDLHERQRRLSPAHPAISADPGHPGHGGERGAGRRRRAEGGARRRAGGSREAVLRRELRLASHRRTRLRRPGPAPAPRSAAALRAPPPAFPAPVRRAGGPLRARRRRLAARAGHLLQLLRLQPAAPRRAAFVGLDNYVHSSTDDAARNSLVTTFIFTVSAVALEFAPRASGSRLLLWRDSVFHRICLALLLIPVTVTPLVVGLVFRALLAPDYGMIGYFAAALGLSPPRGFFGDPGTALGTLVVVDAWQWTPFMALILLAGLKSLPTDVLEAAEADGATAAQRFRIIILPMLLPAIFLALVLRTMDAFRVFDIVFATTNGGPADATDVLMIYGVKQGLQFFNIGFASAIANT